MDNTGDCLFLGDCHHKRACMPDARMFEHFLLHGIPENKVGPVLGSFLPDDLGIEFNDHIGDAGKVAARATLFPVIPYPAMMMWSESSSSGAVPL